MILLNIAGGVALILFGVRFLRKGLERLFGGSLIEWLQRVTDRRSKGFLTGVAVAAIAPSSTTIALISIKMLQTGSLTAERLIAVMLGANIGITITVQLIAFRLYDLFAVFIIVGLIGFQFLERNVLRGIGQCILALGFIFLAMSIISRAAAGVPHDGDLATVVQILHAYPVLLMLLSAVLAMLLQSSTATIGLGLALVDGGLATLELLVPLIVGVNLGIAGTAMLAGWGSIEGRRLAAANLLLKAAGAAVIVMLLPPVVSMVAESPGSALRQGANFHTAFNLFVAAFGLPAIPLVARLMRALIQPAPAPQAVVEPPRSYLDPHSLSSGSLSLVNATRETLRMADEVKAMLENFWRAFKNADTALARQVQHHDDLVDDLNLDIKEYLSRISEESLGPRESNLQFTLLNFTSELEAIGDLVDKSLCHQLIKLQLKGMPISPDDAANLEELFERVMQRFQSAISVLATRDQELAQRMIETKEHLNEWCRSIQTRHYERLNAGDLKAVESSSYYIEFLNGLRRVSSHLTSVAYPFAK